MSSTDLYLSLALLLTTMGSRLVTIFLLRLHAQPSAQLRLLSVLRITAQGLTSSSVPADKSQGAVLSILQHLGGSKDPSGPESSGFLEDEQTIRKPGQMN